MTNSMAVQIMPLVQNGLLHLLLTLLLCSPLSTTEPRCGGRLTSKFGVIVTPNFPNRFSTPLLCKWVIENTGQDADARLRRHARPGLFVNGPFDSALDENEGNRTMPNRSGNKRLNGTKRATHRKQVKLKPSTTSRPTLMTNAPHKSFSATSFKSSLAQSRFSLTNVTSETNENADVIVVYLTQLYVTTGLVIKEYAYYEDEATKYAERVVFSANDKNVLTELTVSTERPFLVIEFGLDRLDTNHVRALDNLLDVYGFNVTYDVMKSRDLPRVKSCSVATCSYNGHCFASANFRSFFCSCFEGFSGQRCEVGPLCRVENRCSGRSICRQLGSRHSSCECPPGTSGPSCLDCDNGMVSSCSPKCPGSSPGLSNKLTAECTCVPAQQAILPQSSDSATYEAAVSVNISSSHQRGLLFSAEASSTVQTALVKYLGASNLGNLTNVLLLNITNYGDVRFQFVCSKQDGSKARDAFNQLVERAKLGPFVLVPTKLAFKQHSSLVLKSVSANQNTAYRPGDAMQLTCVTQGSALANISWYKDGDPVIPNLAAGNISTTLTLRDQTNSSSVAAHSSQDFQERVATLHVSSVTPGHAGLYTCHVSDWTCHACRHVAVGVTEFAPHVRLEPRSLTVAVGSRVQIKCLALNELRTSRKFGYSWTKNRKLFPNAAGHEVWEELSPGGSLLTVFNLQETSTYTCHVHGAFASVAKSLTVYVRRQSLGSLTCGHAEYKTLASSGLAVITWQETLADVTAMQVVDYLSLVSSRGASDRHVKQRPECLITRRCALVGSRAEWRLPDFSKCPTPVMATIQNDLSKLSLGFVSSNISQLLTRLRAENAAPLSPGSREVTVDILSQMLTYASANLNAKVNAHSRNSSLHGISDYQSGDLSQQLKIWREMVYDMLDLTLRTEHSLMNPEKLDQLFHLLQSWHHFLLHHSPPTSSYLTIRDSFLSQSLHLNASAFTKHPTDDKHPVNQETSQVHGVREVDSHSLPRWYNVTELYNHPVVVLSPQQLSQGAWSPRVVLMLDRNLTLLRQSREGVGLVVSCFSQRFTALWPGKFNTQTRYDHEDYFDYKGSIVDVSISTSRKLSTLSPLQRTSIEIDFPLVSGLYSNLTCASKAAFESHWELGRCKTLLFANFTKCVCAAAGGLYSVAARGGKGGQEFSFLAHQDILHALPLSLAISLLLYSVTAAILFSRWLTRHASILFLKLQCTAAHTGATLVFLYSAQFAVDQSPHDVTMNILEFLLLVALSCHVSTLLVVCTELTLSSRIPHMKPSIITILTVIPVLAVLCNTLSSSPSPHLPPLSPSPLPPLSYIYVCYACAVLLTYSALYVRLLLKLRRLEDKAKISQTGISKRKGLLHRSCVIFISTVTMETCSIVYVNKRCVWSQWLFSGSCIISGVIVLCCYVLYSESARDSLMRKHREGKERGGVTSQQEFSSDSDPLHLFIKEDKEEENTSAPFDNKDSIPLSNLPAQGPPIPDILEERPKSGHPHPTQLTPPISLGLGNLTKSDLQTLHSLNSPGGQLNFPMGQLSCGVQMINPNHNQLNSPHNQIRSSFGQLTSAGIEISPNHELNSPRKQFNPSPSECFTVHADPLNQSAFSSQLYAQSRCPKGPFTSMLGEFTPAQGPFTSSLGEYSSAQGAFTSPKAACTPMKFVKFQDEIVTASNADAARLRGEAVTSYGDVMTGGMAGNEVETSGRGCGGLGGCLDIQGDPSSIPVFLCSVDVEPSHRTHLDHPVYENQQAVRCQPHIQGASKVYPENPSSSQSVTQDRYTSCDFERRLPVDPVCDGKCSSEVYSRRLSTDPVLNRITSDLDYILNRPTAEFGSLKRSLGQKGILKKTSSYGKSFEDLRVDARTNL